MKEYYERLGWLGGLGQLSLGNLGTTVIIIILRSVIHLNYCQCVTSCVLARSANNVEAADEAIRKYLSTGQQKYVCTNIPKLALTPPPPITTDRLIYNQYSVKFVKHCNNQ